MRSVSKKRAKLIREMREARRTFAMEHEACCVCGERKEITVHEIVRGAFREKGYQERCTWLPACFDCNSGPLHSHIEWPIAYQLALKAICDLEYYDRRKVNELRGRSPDDVTEMDVLWAMQQILHST